MPKLTKNSFLLFIHPILAFFRINLIGQLAYSELLSLLTLFSFKSIVHIMKDKDTRQIIFAYSLFFLSQILSDYLNVTDYNDYLRGWANILFAIITLIFFSINLKNHISLIILILLGSAVRYSFWGESEMLNFTVDLNDMAFFKFRLINALNPIVLIISWYLLKKKVNSINSVILLFLIYSIFCLVFNARSNSFIFIFSSIILKYKETISGISFKKLLSYSLIFIFFFQLLYSLYIYEVIRGNIGEGHTKSQIMNIQNPYNPIELLLIGRSEVVVAFEAITDKPIFGHGSWAEDKGGKYLSRIYKLQKNNEMFQRILEDQNEKFRIPGHSVLFGAWMNAGILGFISIFFIFILFVKRSMANIRDNYSNNDPFLPIMIFFTFNGIWIFLFSPLPHIKLSLPIIICFNLAYNRVLTNKITRETIKLKQ